MQSYRSNILTVYAVFIGIQAGLGLKRKLEEDKTDERRKLQEKINL